MDGEDTEDFEGGGDEKRVDGSKPRGRTGFAEEWIAEAAAGDQGVGNAAGFLFEGSGGEGLAGNFSGLIPGEAQTGAERDDADEKK